MDLTETSAYGQTTPDLVHLPLATTALSAIFVATLLCRARQRKWAPHLVWWTIGVLFYGVSTAVESVITLNGNSADLNRLWYLFGAIWGAFSLGVGSMYLLCPRELSHTIAGVMLPVVLATSVLVLIAPMNVDVVPVHQPLERGLFVWEWVPWLTWTINAYAVVFLIGGAVWSNINFMVRRYNPRRAMGTGLIAFGALLLGLGVLTKSHGLVESLYVGEFVGLAMVCAGMLVEF